MIESNPQLVVALAFTALTALLMVVGLFRFQRMDETVKLWALLGPLMGAVAGFYITREYKKEQTERDRSQIQSLAKDKEIISARADAEKKQLLGRVAQAEEQRELLAHKIAQFSEQNTVLAAQIDRLSLEKNSLANRVNDLALENTSLVGRLEKESEEKGLLLSGIKKVEALAAAQSGLPGELKAVQADIQRLSAVFTKLLTDVAPNRLGPQGVAAGAANAVPIATPRR